MEELIATIARGLVDDKEAVSVTADPADEEGNVVYHLHVGAEDMGRVIGKQGRIAKSGPLCVPVPISPAAVRRSRLTEQKLRGRTKCASPCVLQKRRA